MMFRYKLLPVYLIGCLTFCGCSETSSLPDHSSDNSSEAAEIDVNENFFASTAMAGNYVSYYSSDNIYYIDNKVSYVKAENNNVKKAVLCAQTGCSHSDETCNAFLSAGLSECILYHDVWYFTTFDNGSASFKSLDQKTGERKTYVVFKATQYSTYTLTLAGCTGGKAYLYFMENGFDSDNKQYIKNSILKIDLDTGKDKEILCWSHDNGENWGYFGGYENYILLTHNYYPEKIIQFEEWEGTEEDYMSFLSSLETCFEIIILDTESLSQTTVVSKDETDLIVPSELSISIGQYFILQFGDTIRRYDITTGKYAEILKHSGIINYFVYDSKVFYLVRNGSLELWCADLDGTDEIQLENPDANFMTFSICGESSDLFFGLMEDGEYLIRKQDFYDGKYSQAFPIGK